MTSRPSDILPRRRFTPLGVFLAASLCGSLAAPAQTVTDDPAIEELRVRTPVGANDDATIDGWLNKLIDQVAGATDPLTAGRDLQSKLNAVRNAPDTTPLFINALTGRLGEVARGRITKLPAPAADTLTRALLTTNDKRTIPGLIAALTHDADSVRYLGAKGLKNIRDSLQTAEMGSVVDALKQAGVAEKNGVVAERIYAALSFPAPTPATLGALADVLAARVDRYRKGALPVDSAEASLARYLATVQIPQAQSTRFVSNLATLLRLDVERYDNTALGFDVRIAIELRIDACESLIQRITGAGGGNVRSTMQAGGLAVATAMKLELIKWIGDNADGGALTPPPWNVPRGAP